MVVIYGTVNPTQEPTATGREGQDPTASPTQEPTALPVAIPTPTVAPTTGLYLASHKDPSADGHTYHASIGG